MPYTVVGGDCNCCDVCDCISGSLQWKIEDLSNPQCESTNFNTGPNSFQFGGNGCVVGNWTIGCPNLDGGGIEFCCSKNSLRIELGYATVTAENRVYFGSLIALTCHPKFLAIWEIKIEITLFGCECQNVIRITVWEA
jgi:hypothetical protein